MSDGKSRRRRKGPRLTRARVLGACAAFITIGTAVQLGWSFIEWLVRMLS